MSLRCKACTKFMKKQGGCRCNGERPRLWQADFWVGTLGAKRRQWRTTDCAMTRAEAKDWYSGLKVDARRGQVELLPTTPHTFAAAAARFLRDYQAEVRPSTFANAETLLRLYLLPRFGALDVKALDVTAVKDLRHQLLQGIPRSALDARLKSFEAELRRTAKRDEADLRGRITRERERILSRPLSTRSIRAILDTLGMVLACAVEEKWIAANPVRELRRKRFNGPPAREPVPLTRGELLRLEELTRAEESRWRLPVMLMAFGALRRGEAFGLQARDFDRARGAVRIDRIITPDGVAPPKKNSAREVPLPAWLVAEMDAHLSARKVAALNGSDWTFAGRSGKPLCRNVEREWARIRARLAAECADAARRVKLFTLRLHDLRHSAATALDESGAHGRAVQDILGHRTATMTAHYTHPTLAAKRAAVDLLPVPQNRCETAASKS